MIPFFRKIRKQFSDDNKPLKYLRYAIGEIVLVVIGILIALQINNWNENSKNKSLETSYLIRISKDLDNDLLEYKGTSELALERNNRVLFLEQAIKDPQLVEKSPDYFIKSIGYAGYTYRPAISNHSFEELKSSGRLELINNEDLRVSIAKYYDFEFSYSQFDFIREDVQLKYNEYARGILDQEQLNWVLTTYNSPDAVSNLSKKELDGIYQRFLSKKEFHSILPQVFESKFNFIEAMVDSNKNAKKLKHEIQKELNGN
ncbi:MAG: DUF6090 family protein [Maribacter sp.]|nr:DUF6090 family protein [Maribacter sp.]